MAVFRCDQLAVGARVSHSDRLDVPVWAAAVIECHGTVNVSVNTPLPPAVASAKKAMVAMLCWRHAAQFGAAW